MVYYITSYPTYSATLRLPNLGAVAGVVASSSVTEGTTSGAAVEREQRMRRWRDGVLAWVVVMIDLGVQFAAMGRQSAGLRSRIVFIEFLISRCILFGQFSSSCFCY